jgi:maleate isomerase
MDSGEMLTVGVLTPHTTPGPKVEMQDMAAGQVRVEVSRIRDGSTSPHGLRTQAEPAALDEAPSALPPAVGVLAFASTGSGYALGYGEESALVRRLRDRWHVPVCATSRSAVAAMRLRQIERISLVHPPWFGTSLNELGAEYFRSQGFKVVDARLADVPDDPDHVEPGMVVDWVAKHLCHRAEAVFIGGNGFRVARAVHPLECRTGRLVVQANQVLLWSVLRNARARISVRGFGTLFDDDPGGHTREEG